MTKKIAKKSVVFAAIATIVLAAIANQYFAASDPAATNTGSTANHGTGNEHANLPEELAPESAAATQEQENSLTEIVEGLPVYRGRNCTIEKRYVDIGDGTIVEGFVCVPDLPTPEGKFASVPDDALEVLSYSDPDAAEILGKRLVETDPGKSYDLLLRSVALRPRNTDPILWLADQSYSLTNVNGSPALESMSTNYVLSRVAEELGSPVTSASKRRQLEQAGFGTEDFERLEVVVREHLTRIDEVRSEVGLGSIDTEAES